MDKLKTSITLRGRTPLYLDGELSGVAEYTVDLTGLLSVKQVNELQIRLDKAIDRASKKAAIEAADILRKLDRE